MTENETRFQERLRSGESILIVEVAPPKGGDPVPLRSAAKRYDGKVHAIGLSDNRRGVGMASLAAAAIVAAEGMEPILQWSPGPEPYRPIADCLGAQALGVRISSAPAALIKTSAFAARPRAYSTWTHATDQRSRTWGTTSPGFGEQVDGGAFLPGRWRPLPILLSCN
jgi:hypothetical protein